MRMAETTISTSSRKRLGEAADKEALHDDRQYTDVGEHKPRVEDGHIEFHQRLSEVSGTLKVESTLAVGTTVTAEVKLS